MSTTTSNDKTTSEEKRGPSPHEPQAKFWKRRPVKPQGHPVYDDLLWRLQTRQESEPSMAIGITGATSGAGSTTIAAGLAIRAAEQQADRTLLVDAHGNSGGLLETFRLSNGPGLSEILAGTLSLREFEPARLLDNLDLMRAGNPTRTGSLRLHNHLVEEVLAELSQQYSLIVVDLPSSRELRRATPLATHLSGTLLVVRSESVKRAELMRAVQQMRQDGIKLWGTVLNRKIEYLPSWLRGRI